MCANTRSENIWFTTVGVGWHSKTRHSDASRYRKTFRLSRRGKDYLVGKRDVVEFPIYPALENSPHDKLSIDGSVNPDGRAEVVYRVYATPGE